MSKKFTEQEKEFITLRLKQECELAWGKFGYKKSNIDDLCKKVGISKGAFYIFFNSKEQLFIDTLKYRMLKQQEKIKHEMRKNPNNKGFFNAVMLVYQENAHGRWLENLTGPEFQLLLSKMPKETIKEIQSYDQFLKNEIIELYQLKFKISPTLFMMSIQSIYNTALHRDIFGDETDTITEILLDSLFKENAL